MPFCRRWVLKQKGKKIMTGAGEVKHNSENRTFPRVKKCIKN